jgi:hypothetical protein
VATLTTALPRSSTSTGVRLGAVLTGFFVIVVVVSSISGVALLVAPNATDAYFSWTLQPRWAASLTGGMYIGSAALFGWTLRRRSQVEALALGVYGLALPTLAFTFVHDEVFDWSRWQAVAWVVLFGTALVAVTLDLVSGRRATPQRSLSTPLPGGERLGWGALSLLAFVVAVAVWVTGSSLTIRYLGCWASFGGVVFATTALTGRRCDAQVASMAIVTLGGGAALAALSASCT